MKNRWSSQEIAETATFAAISAIVIKIVPGIPIVGVSGATLNFNAALAPVYGLIIGPYLGFLAALVGGVITAGSPFDLLTSFAPAVSALTAGLLTQKGIRNDESRIKGWMLASAIMSLLILGWYLSDIGQKAPFYPVLHFAGLALMILTRNKIVPVFRAGRIAGSSWTVKPHFYLAGIITLVVAFIFIMPYLNSVEILSVLAFPLFLAGTIMIVYGLFGIGKSAFALAVSIASYCGVIADHMLGNLVFVSSINIFIPLTVVNDSFLKPLGLPDVSSLFMYMIPVSAVERLVFTLIATITGVGLVLAIRRANLSTRRS